MLRILRRTNCRCSAFRSSLASLRCTMTTPYSEKASLSHEERTATEPRDESLHTIILDKVMHVNDRIRTFQFAAKDGREINFLPGQWLDVFCPGIEKAGGFTITSSPHLAKPDSANPLHKPFLELAIQKSPENPPAAWLWQTPESIIGEELVVRVGGSFVWPPLAVTPDRLRRAVLIAGGVGINPLISMLSDICKNHPNLEIHFLYSTKLPSSNANTTEVLFLARILELLSGRKAKATLDLHLTGTWDNSLLSNEVPLARSLTQDTLKTLVKVHIKRIEKGDLLHALGSHNEQESSAFYVCGPPEMTDEIVDYYREQEDLSPERVLCEKWW